MPLAVTLRLMLFEHSSRSYFLGPVTLAPRPLRTLLDMFILPLFFSAHTVEMFFPWHLAPFYGIWHLSTTLSLVLQP
jgi:hypothetical protein